jgi:hypothetical protein
MLVALCVFFCFTALLDNNENSSGFIHEHIPIA